MTTTVSDSSGFTIRQARRADLLEIRQIEKQSFPQPWPYRAFEEFLSSRGFLVAFDRTVVGYIVAGTFSNHGKRIGHVKDLAVRQARRNEGIGSRLLERALGVLAVAGISKVKLEVRPSNEAARSLYHRFGFEHSHTIPQYYENGEDALILVADLLEK